jgi:succinoglycan biosynthesis transport protein ExoP
MGRRPSLRPFQAADCTRTHTPGSESCIALSIKEAGRLPADVLMLQVNKTRPTAELISASEIASPEELYAAFVAFVRRQFPIIAFVVLLMVGLATLYVFTTPPRYMAEAVLIIDTHKLNLFQQQSPLGVDVPVDTAIVDSQVEVLKSETIALSVIKELHLTDDPEFVGPSGGLIGTVFSVISRVTSTLFGDGGPNSKFRITRKALALFEKRLTIKRVGLTYVINIDYESLRPERAAQIANAVADAYVTDTLEAKYQSTKRAAIWLQDRLKELRAQATAADRAVVEFKAKNNIVDTGGRLLNEQQLAELNSALVLARAQTAEAQARADRVQQILQKEDQNAAFEDTATVTDTLHDDVITRLRQQYLDIAARESDWSRRYGQNHLAAVNLRNQMSEIRKSIDNELRHIAETYKSDYVIAKSREAAVQKGLDDIVSQSNETNQAQITLRELDSTAQNYRAMADNFMQQYMMSVQQQSFPITESRLITQATPPLKTSHPKTLLVLAIATAVGIILALGIGMLRDFSDRVFRTGGQVESLLQTDCIAVLPFVKGAPSRDLSTKSFTPKPIGPRNIVHQESLLWHVVDTPFSHFSEGISAIKIAADLLNGTKPNRVMGVTSALPDEGKSTIAVALAQLMAGTGSRVVLVDCDIRNPQLSRHITPSASIGLIEMLSGRIALQDVIWTDSATGLNVLPTVIRTRIRHTSAILASKAMKRLVDGLQEVYDFVVVDLSPLAPVVDVQATTNLVDSYLFVIEWGRTRIELVQHVLNAARGVNENLLGVVLNKAKLDVLNRYESHRGDHYYKRYYTRYGYAE